MQTVCIVFWTVIVTVFFSIMTIFVSFLSKTGELTHKVVSVWARFILFGSGVRVKVRGYYYIDPSESYIYMPNHQSDFDIPVLLAHLKVQFRWLAKAELFKIPFFGQAMRRAGYISINRKERRAAFESLKKAAEMIRNGVSVLIFPEGTRSNDGKIAPFKKGGFLLAVDSGVPIMPIIIYGTREIMPKDRLVIKPGNVILEIRKPIETYAYTRKRKNDLIETVRQVICESFDKNSLGRT
jgi:1-acyl-sn-glycerol-3-phosphate acyltransferase